MLWVPMREVLERKLEQQQLLLDVSCSFMSISNSRRAVDDSVHPCLAPPAPLNATPPSIHEVRFP